MSFKEQMITIPVQADGLVLEGVWQGTPEAPRGAVIAPPHPQFGGSLENPVVNEIAHTLYQADYACVRFNWRGVGASQGKPSGRPRDAEIDYQAALDHLDHTLSVPLTGAGYSFGAATAIRVALEDARIRELILVAPPVEMIQDLELAKFTGPVRVIVGGLDEYAPAAELSAVLEPTD